MERVAGREGQAQWPEAGSPPAAWFEAMDRVEGHFNAYALKHGMAQIPSPNAPLRGVLEGAVTIHAYMRRVDPPHIDEWRTAARDVAALVQYALRVNAVPFLIPSIVAPLHLAVLYCLLPEKRKAMVDGHGWTRFERADLELLKTRATKFAAEVRAQQGRKTDVALRELRKSVSHAIEMYCGPKSAKSYMDWIAGDPGGLLYKVIAEIQPWLRGLEDLTPNALRLAIQRVGPRPRKPRRHER
jgi:hypothetical protein